MTFLDEFLVGQIIVYSIIILGSASQIRANGAAVTAFLQHPESKVLTDRSWLALSHGQYMHYTSILVPRSLTVRNNECPGDDVKARG